VGHDGQSLLERTVVIVFTEVVFFFVVVVFIFLSFKNWKYCQ